MNQMGDVVRALRKPILQSTHKDVRNLELILEVHCFSKGIDFRWCLKIPKGHIVNRVGRLCLSARVTADFGIGVWNLAGGWSSRLENQAWCMLPTTEDLHG